MAVFSDIYTQVEREVHKTIATTYLADVKNAVVSAIRYYEHKPAWFTEKVGSDLTLSQASDNVSLPADFGSMAHLRIVANGQFLDEDSGFEPVAGIKELRKKTGVTQKTATPGYWTLFNSKIYTDTLADSSYTLKIDYYQKDAAYPSNANDTSIWFEEGYDVIRLMAISIHYGDRLHDEQNEAKYFARAEAAFKNLQARSNLRQRRWRLA